MSKSMKRFTDDEYDEIMVDGIVTDGIDEPISKNNNVNKSDKNVRNNENKGKKKEDSMLTLGELLKGL